MINNDKRNDECNDNQNDKNETVGLMVSHENAF